jgi:hypothetical protein
MSEISRNDFGSPFGTSCKFRVDAPDALES